MRPSIAGVFTPRKIVAAADPEGWVIAGRGTPFKPQIDVTDLKWFKALYKEQNNFSLGFNRIKSDVVVAALYKYLDTITTTIDREFLAKIVAGCKRIEYREIKPYWTQRLRKVGRPFRLVLRNGMSPPIPVVTVRIDRVTTDSRKDEYLLHIGEVLRVEHWDRKRQRPR
jgi:hypothetical protein